MVKPTIAVIFGSRSAEHDVSIVTALASIIKPLELMKKYTVVPVYIAKDGRWFSDEKLKDIHFYTSGKIDSYLKRAKPIAVRFDGGSMTLLLGGLKSRAIKIDVAFPATHGTYGEDGSLMGLFEMAGIPYVGCDVASSAIAMDKVLAKTIVSAAGIPTPNFFAFSKHDYFEHSDEWLKRIKKGLRFPVFVKPPHLGSSIGITRVDKPEDLQNAIEVAVHYDDKALVEEAVHNLIEVTVPIMGNEAPIPALVEQPLVSAEDFFDFDTKYMQGGKKGGAKGAKQGAQGYSKIPADISEGLYDKARDAAINVYKTVGCSGIARIDLLIDNKSGEVYFNEINPLPGDLYAHNWRMAGVSGVELVERLISFAQQRFDTKQQLTTTFSTNYLKQF